MPAPGAPGPALDETICAAVRALRARLERVRDADQRIENTPYGSHVTTIDALPPSPCP